MCEIRGGGGGGVHISSESSGLLSWGVVTRSESPTVVSGVVVSGQGNSPQGSCPSPGS